MFNKVPRVNYINLKFKSSSEIFSSVLEIIFIFIFNLFIVSEAYGSIQKHLCPRS